MSKVAQINLEYGMPTADAAVMSMKNALVTYKRQNYKAVILIHGYGSSGVGGKIKTSVLRSLGDSSMRGIVRSYVGGEQWVSRKREMLSICRDLENYQQTLTGNPGITVVILR
jgi:predicted esterase